MDGNSSEQVKLVLDLRYVDPHVVTLFKCTSKLSITRRSPGDVLPGDCTGNGLEVKTIFQVQKRTTIGGLYAIAKSETIFTLTSYNYYNITAIVKLEMISL